MQTITIRAKDRAINVAGLEALPEDLAAAWQRHYRYTVPRAMARADARGKPVVLRPTHHHTFSIDHLHNIRKEFAYAVTLAEAQREGFTLRTYAQRSRFAFAVVALRTWNASIAEALQNPASVHPYLRRQPVYYARPLKEGVPSVLQFSGIWDLDKLFGCWCQGQTTFHAIPHEHKAYSYDLSGTRRA